MARSKYLTRSGQGYQVRLQDAQGNYYSRYFADGLHGGHQRARSAAVAWRDQELAAQGRLGWLRRQRARMPRQSSHRNRSGVIGVIRIDSLRRQPNGQLRHDLGWKGYGMIDGKHWVRYFAVAKYGECTAFQLACQARYERQGALRIVGDPALLPCLPDCPYWLNEDVDQNPEKL